MKNDETFLRRTRGIGVMTASDAERLGVVGPTARASGVSRDLRIDSPLPGLCPASSEYRVRQDRRPGSPRRRSRQRTVRELSSDPRNPGRPPVGRGTARMPRKIKEGETISRLEAPRGELFYFVKSNGSIRPERVKICTPSLRNFNSVTALAVGHQLADMPMLLAGIDPCFSCNDRAVIVRRTGGDHMHWSWERLRQYGIEHYQRRSHMAKL